MLASQQGAPFKFARSQYVSTDTLQTVRFRRKTITELLHADGVCPFSLFKYHCYEVSTRATRLFDMKLWQGRRQRSVAD